MRNEQQWLEVRDLLQSAAAAPAQASKSLQSVIDSEEYVFPGAELLVAERGRVLFHEAVGCKSLVEEVVPNQKGLVYDIASLTKVMVTTTLAMQLVDDGRLDVSRRLSHIFQTFGTHGKEQMTVRHLLTHCSGYPATQPYYKQLAASSIDGMPTPSRGAAEQIVREIFRGKLNNLPGKVTEYSDIGFILLGHVLTTLYGESALDKLAVTKIFAPLRLRSTGYIDLANVRRGGVKVVSDTILPTLSCPWRGRVLCGEVHDDNAWAMGGIAPHAGVFSTAEDVHRFALALIDCYSGRGSLISRDTVRHFWKRDGSIPGSTWALGWDTPSEHGSSAGQYFSKEGVGHLGYTGCSLWIDPTAEIDVVLLSNRIHPSAKNQAIKSFRPKIHDAVMKALGRAGA